MTMPVAMFLVLIPLSPYYLSIALPTFPLYALHLLTFSLILYCLVYFNLR